MQDYNNKNGGYINKPKQITILLILLLFENIYKKKAKIKNNPKISIFLPIYNKAVYLKNSIKSIQIQTLKNIEIIAINDCSKDNTLEVLMKMAKKDSRIKIFTNNKNRGLLYSRAMGILNSRGEYLMNLDPDDELYSSDNLEYLYNITKKSKIDVISFGFIKQNNLNISKHYLCSNFNKIHFQPEIINTYYNKIDYLLWNKLVKRKLFLKVYEIFKEKIYSVRWNYNEDEIWSALINKYANSKFCVKKIIYKYKKNPDSLLANKFNLLYIKNLIYWIELFTKLFNNEIGKILLIDRFNELIKRINDNTTFFLNIFNKNSDIKNKYIKILKNIKNKYIFNNSKLNNIIEILKI